MESQKELHPNRGQPAGYSNETKHATNDNSLGTAAATERRIVDLRTAMDAAAAAGDVATYKQHQAEYTKALAARSPDRISQLNAQHLAAVERAVAMANHGLRQVPARWLKLRHNTRVALEPAESFNGLDEAEVLRSA